MRIAAFALLLLCTACWSPSYFAPREHADATAPGGMPAANYAVPTGASDAPPTAELRVWSNGAKARFTDDNREVVELHVGFELENNSAIPLQLDLGAIAVEELVLDGVLQKPLVPLHIAGDGLSLPKTTARVDAIFEPGTTYPRHIDAFAVRFRVTGDGREMLHQVTPFGPHVRSYDRYHDSGWGWGWGFGFGFAHTHWH